MEYDVQTRKSTCVHLRPWGVCVGGRKAGWRSLGPLRGLRMFDKATGKSSAKVSEPSVESHGFQNEPALVSHPLPVIGGEQPLGNVTSKQTQRWRQSAALGPHSL